MKSVAGAEVDRLSGPGLRAFFRIADAWKMTLAEQQNLLGGVARQTIYNWKARPHEARLTGDQLDRLSYTLGIYKALHIIFTRPEQADTWMRRANSAPPFGGRPAAELMFGPHMEDLIRVRRYLDGARSGW